MTKEGQEQWVVVETHFCDVLQREADLLEQRVYSPDVIPDMEPYRVTAHKCSAAVECNLMGCQCEWSYTGPGVDRMHLD